MKTFRKIHLWLSVPFGIIVTLICFSGAMLVFEPEITRTVKHTTYYASQAGGTPIPMDKLLERVEAQLPDSVSITGVTVFADPTRTYEVSLSKPRRASVFVDQYTGQVTGRYERLAFFSTTFRLHRWLLDSSSNSGVRVGKLLVGISTIAFVLALVTGVVLWWPRARRNLGRSLSVSLRHGLPILWRTLHVAGGMYGLVLLLAMSLTGLTWSFDWYRSAFYAVCGATETSPRTAVTAPAKAGADVRSTHPGGDTTHSSEFAHWQAVHDRLRQHSPDAPQISIKAGSASVTLGNAGNSRAADSYEFDNRTGHLTSSARYADASPAGRLRGWIISLHTGSWGGLPTRLLWFLAALLGATLPLTGYYIWLKRRFFS